MDSHVRYGKPLLPARLGAMLVGAFGLLGLILASVGVYAVIAYSVGQRTQELGIRMALGARPVNVITMVLRQGMTLSLIGMGVGNTLVFLMLRAMRSVLYGVGSTDFPTLGAVSLLLLAVVFVASYIPTLRATKVDPGCTAARIVHRRVRRRCQSGRSASRLSTLCNAMHRPLTLSQPGPAER